MENNTTTAEGATLSPRMSCIPPRLFERNEFGLICDGSIEYVYNEDGTINWRKMVKPEFLVPNKQVFEKTGRPVPTSIEGLEDKELIILLGGLRELAAIRGYSCHRFPVIVAPSDNYVIATCEMSWIPNYETQGRSVISSAVGDAKPENTNALGKLYLAPFAENRAFVRCIRQFLRINIVSQEEIAEMAAAASDDVATTLLKETITKYGITFEAIKAKLVEEKVEGATNYTGVSDIPRYKQFELIERIKRKAAAKEAGTTAQ